MESRYTSVFVETTAEERDRIEQFRVINVIATADEAVKMLIRCGLEVDDDKSEKSGRQN